MKEEITKMTEKVIEGTTMSKGINMIDKTEGRKIKGMKGTREIKDMRAIIRINMDSLGMVTINIEKKNQATIGMINTSEEMGIDKIKPDSKRRRSNLIKRKRVKTKEIMKNEKN